ncbi:hypothetical protein WJX72_011752 [[Myrmecia] bisecta]|uniref:Uncharacterized protein n=1 Tax=[Myrmecia] bisecta TaxID=41462 RepID=A0AAW1PTF2_9CHLO
MLTAPTLVLQRLLLVLALVAAAVRAEPPLLQGNTLLSTGSPDPCFEFNGARPYPAAGCNVFQRCDYGIGELRKCPAGMAAGPTACEFAASPCAMPTNASAPAPAAAFTPEPAPELLPAYGYGFDNPGVIPEDFHTLEFAYLTNTSNMAVRSGDAYLFGGDPARVSLVDGATSGSLTYQLPSAVGSATLRVWVFASNGVRLSVSAGNATGLQVFAHASAPGANLTKTDDGNSVSVYFGNNGNSQVWTLHALQIYTPSLSKTITLGLEVREENKGEAWKVQLGQLNFHTLPLTLTSLIPTTTAACWQTSEYGRGSGTIPQSCAPGYEFQAGFCYAVCEPGYVGVGPVCWGPCPAGTTDIGAICSSPVRTVSSDYSSCRWWNCCGIGKWDGYGCSNNCPAGYTWYGCTCTKGDTSVTKPSHGRPPVLPQCEAGKEEQGGLCYTPCQPEIYSAAGAEASKVFQEIANSCTGA